MSRRHVPRLLLIGGAIVAGLVLGVGLDIARTGGVDAWLAGGDSHAVALTGGYHLAFWIAAGVVAASIVAALVLLEQPQRAKNGASEPALSHA